MAIKNWILFFGIFITAAIPCQSQQKRLTTEDLKFQDAYLSAQVDIYMQRYENAIPKLLKLFKENLNDAVIAFELAKAYDHIEDYPNADKYSAIAVREDPENVWMLLFYAQLMVKMEKYDEAAKSFAQLNNIDGDDYSHIENQAKALLKLGKGEEAIAAIDSWQENNGILEELIRLKFDYYESRNETSKAEKELINLLNSAPGNIRYLNNLATFYKKNNEGEKARAYYEAVLEIDPNDPKANAALFTLVEDSKKDGPFLRSLLPLIEKKDIDPDLKVLELIPYVNQFAEMPTEDLSSSLLSLSETLVLIHPTHAKSLAIRADILQLSGKKDEAINAYKKTLEYNKKVYDVWEQLFYLLSETERYDDLSKWSYSAMDYFPNKPTNYLMYGLAQNELGNPSESLDYLQEGLMIAANDTVVKSKIYTQMARSYLLKNDIAAAESNIDEALKLSQEKNAFAWEVKGDIMAHKGDGTKAQEYWSKAKDLGSTRTALLNKINQ